jgi:hypothetical protein
MRIGKREQYLCLVKKRKEHVFSEGLLNPSEIENGKYDMEDHVGPWSMWQGNLNAHMLLIGQDWGNLDYYRNNKGFDTDGDATPLFSSNLQIPTLGPDPYPQRRSSKLLRRCHNFRAEVINLKAAPMAAASSLLISPK